VPPVARLLLLRGVEAFARDSSTATAKPAQLGSLGSRADFGWEVGKLKLSSIEFKVRS